MSPTRIAAALALVVLLAACTPRYVIDDQAQRCRDTGSGRWVEMRLCAGPPH